MDKRHIMVAVIGCSVLVSACGSSSDDSAGSATEGTEPTGSEPTSCPTDGEEWEVAKVYIEHNATDEDTGIHGLIGGAPWRSVCVTAPDGTRLWAIQPADRLDDLGVADFFWESNEPPDDEYPLDELMADFPEGDYTISGTGVDGVDRIAQATFTHDIPAEPTITHPPLVPDLEEGDPEVVDGAGLVIRWEPVTETVDGRPVDITWYQVIVTDEESEDPNGWARPVYDVHVAPDVTALPVPDQFVEADTLYEVEVLAIEPSGNQTISVGFFRTA